MNFTYNFIKCLCTYRHLYLCLLYNKYITYNIYANILNKLMICIYINSGVEIMKFHLSSQNPINKIVWSFPDMICF